MTSLRSPKKTKRTSPGKKTRKPWIWGHKQLSVYVLSISFLLSAFIATCLYLIIALNIPSIKTLSEYKPAATTLIYDSQKNRIGRSYTENRLLINLHNAPKLLPKAFIAAEDARFLQHQGVDGWSILRALIHNIKAGSRGQGGSTITQQVARSLLLSPEKTYIRKIKEAILAYRIDKVLSKNDILHIYLNQIYLGEGSYGVGAAAMTYFGKTVNALSLAEISILAGLPQAPSRYSPFKHFKRAKKRQAYVLNRMAEDGYITPTAARKAYLQPLFWPAQSPPPATASYFVQHVKNYIIKKYGADLLNAGGLRVHTTMDPVLQQASAKAVRHGLGQWGIRQEITENRHPQAALVCMEVKSGKVLALTGGAKFTASQFNRATQARRQPGSAFKPIVYAAALAKGYTPNTMIDDEPVAFKDSRGTWEPKNFSGKFYGPTTLRNGLVYSRNIVTIKLLKEIGIPHTIRLARDMGIDSPLSPDLALALGSSGVSLLELTSSYTVFANGGKYQRPIFITKIIDRNGKTLERNRPNPKQVLDEAVAYQMSYIMKGVIEEGTGKKARGLPHAAGKTGTTDHNMDAWFVGFTPNLATGVWMGHDRQKSLGRRETGGRAAAPLWLAFMKQATAYHTGQDFPIPEGITFIPINSESGDFEYLNTEDALWEAFKKDNLPSWKNRIEH